MKTTLLEVQDLDLVFPFGSSFEARRLYVLRSGPEFTLAFF